MFAYKALTCATLLIGMGGVYSVAEEKTKPIVAPMSESDQKLTKCELHDSRVHTQDVQIAYAHPAEGYIKAMQESFPHANTYALGGCAYSDGAPTMQTVKYCIQCREAEKQWFEARRRK